MVDFGIMVYGCDIPVWMCEFEILSIPMGNGLYFYKKVNINVYYPIRRLLQYS